MGKDTVIEFVDVHEAKMLRRKSRIVLWLALAALALGAVSLVWSGIMMIGMGNAETALIGKWMAGTGTAIVILGSMVDV
jgi:hypothetical protein